MQVGDKVILYPMSDRGANLLNGHNPVGWVIDSIEDKVRFSDQLGPWFLVKKGSDIFWVHGIADVNFKIVLDE